MRTLRLSLVGTVILILLGGLSSGTGAQEAEETPERAVHATGTSSLGEFISPGTQTYTPEGVRQLRGLEATTLDVSSDPRLSGTNTINYNEDQYPDLMGPKWATFSIENEGGAWGGWTVGIELPRADGPNFPVYIGMAEGEGGYEGMSTICYTTYPEGPGWDGVSECIVFPGPLPEIAPPVSE